MNRSLLLTASNERTCQRNNCAHLRHFMLLRREQKQFVAQNSQRPPSLPPFVISLNNLSWALNTVHLSLSLSHTPCLFTMFIFTKKFSFKPTSLSFSLSLFLYLSFSISLSKYIYFYFKILGPILFVLQQSAFVTLLYFFVRLSISPSQLSTSSWPVWPDVKFIFSWQG